MSTVQLCILSGGSIALTGIGYPGELAGNTTGTAYTGSCYPSVQVSGGSGGYVYSWSFTSNPGACSLSNPTVSTCAVSHAITKFGYDGSATLQCVVNDSAGQSITVSNVTATFSST